MTHILYTQPMLRPRGHLRGKMALKGKEQAGDFDPLNRSAAVARRTDTNLGFGLGIVAILPNPHSRAKLHRMKKRHPMSKRFKRDVTIGDQRALIGEQKAPSKRGVALRVAGCSVCTVPQFQLPTAICIKLVDSYSTEETIDVLHYLTLMPGNQFSQPSFLRTRLSLL